MKIKFASFLMILTLLIAFPFSAHADNEAVRGDDNAQRLADENAKQIAAQKFFRQQKEEARLKMEAWKKNTTKKKESLDGGPVNATLAKNTAIINNATSPDSK